MQDGTGLHDTGRSGRPARISDAEIRVEIERRLSGPPEDLVAYRIQRALEARHGSIPQMARVQRLLCEMQLQRQAPAPAPAPRQPEADLDGLAGLVRQVLDEAAGQVCQLLAEAVLAAEDAVRERCQRDLAARDTEIALLREAHAAEILRRDREFQGLVRSADERLEEYQQWREQSDAERARLEMHLRQHEAACADLRLRLDRADADRAAQQQVAERAQGDYNGLATRVGEVTARLEAAEGDRDQARVALAADQEHSVAREQARVAAEARLHEIRVYVERLEAMLERTRQDAAEAGRRVAVLEAALAAERSRANTVRGPRQPRTSSGGARQ